MLKAIVRDQYSPLLFLFGAPNEIADLPLGTALYENHAASNPVSLGQQFKATRGSQCERQARTEMQWAGERGGGRAGLALDLQLSAHFHSGHSLLD